MRQFRYIAAIGLLIVSFGQQTEATLDGHVNYRVYGHLFETPLNQDISEIKIGQLTQKEFDRIVPFIRSKKIEITANNLRKAALEYNLDDLGLTILVKKFTTNVYAESQDINAAVLLQYLILKSLDFDVILTRSNNNLNCLGNLSFAPGAFTYIQYANRNYVDLDYNKKNPASGQHLIFQDGAKTYKTIQRNLLNPVKFNALTKSKDISMQFRGIDYHFSAISNQSYLEYLNDLPMFNLGKDYSRMRFSNLLQNSLMDGLKIAIEDMSTIEASRFLLHFVQNVVPYGDDFSKYGGERYYYPEETVMSVSADCEDKTFLLAYLCRELLKIETVGLFFKEDKHIAIALLIPDYAPTGSFGHNGKTYVPCEPTGKIARLGYAAIDLKRVTEVIPL